MLLLLSRYNEHKSNASKMSGLLIKHDNIASAYKHRQDSDADQTYAVVIQT